MSQPLKLAIFDVDGTLVDSQADIVAAMTAAFRAESLEPPGRNEVLAIVGLSLPEAIGTLAPAHPEPVIGRMVEAYKDSYTDLRKSHGVAASPLYPGIRDTLEALFAREDMLVGVATGKSRRGLDYVLGMHGLAGRFVNEQVSDFHPSKPHPAMLHTALSETGIDAEHSVMIGDTSFDMEMGRAAGCKTLAVNWGYHHRTRLEAAGPDHLIEEVTELHGAVLDLLELPA